MVTYVIQQLDNLSLGIKGVMRKLTEFYEIL